MIQMEEMRQLLCRAYTGLRDQVAANADDWIGEGGEFLSQRWMTQLCALILDRLIHGDYAQSAELFQLVERLLQDGENDVKDAVATGLIEGLQHQRDLAPTLWQPLLGPLARAHCVAMDEFYGIKS